MKRNKIKKAFLLGIVFLFSSLLLWNCETEEEVLSNEIETTQNTTRNLERHVVPLKSLFLEHYQAIEILSKLSKSSLDTHSKNQETYSEEHNLYFTLNEVYIIETEEYEQISFVVRTPDLQDNQFQNYLLMLYPEGGYQQYLATYQYDTSDRESFQNIGFIELQGSQLYSRYLNCPNAPQLVPQTGSVCTYTNCTGTNNHGFADPACTCGHSDPCSPGTETCIEQTFYVWQCGGGGSGSGSWDDSDPNNNNGQTGGGDQTGGDNSGDEEIPVIPIEEETAMDRILECMNTSSFNGSNVTMPQSLIDSLQLDSRCYAPLDHFIQEEGCDFESKSFAIDAARACLNGDEVDYEEKIILDSTFVNHPRLKCVYDKFRQGNNTISQYLENFLGETPVANLRFKADDNFATTYLDYPGAGAITLEPENYLIDIIFNTDSSLNSSAGNFPTIILALEMIHEMVHAEIFRKLLAYAQEPNVPWTDFFIRSLRNNFGGLSDYYTRYSLELPDDQAPNQAQHQMMAQHYRGMIVASLKEFDNNQQPDDVYESLSWIGLMGYGEIDSNTGFYENATEAWKNLSDLDREIINYDINDIKQNGTHNCTD